MPRPLQDWGEPTQPVPFAELASPHPVWMMRIKVVGVDDQPISATHPHFEPDHTIIQQCYTGPNLVGRHWPLPDDHNSRPNSYPVSKLDGARYDVGEELLVTLQANTPVEIQAGSSIDLSFNYYGWQSEAYGLTDPIELDGSPWDGPRLRYAEAIGKAYAAPPQQLEALLREYAQGKVSSQDAVLAMWATQTLGFWFDRSNAPGPLYPLHDRAATLAWLWKLAASTKLPLNQLLVLDELLHRIDPSHWDTSAQRRNSLERLCHLRLNSNDAVTLEGYIGAASAGRPLGISAPQLLSLFAILVRNPAFQTSHYDLLPGLLGLSAPSIDSIFKSTQWLAFCTRNLTPAQQCLYANSLENSIVWLGPLPPGSEADVNTLLTNWRAGLPHSSSQKQWQDIQHAIAALQAMQSGVQLTFPGMTRGYR